MMFETIRQRYQAWQERRFLRRHGCENRTQYERMYDPDHNCLASRIQDYYHGYPYVYCFENYNHYIYQVIADYGPGGRRWGHNVIHAWAEEHSQDKVRFDFLRVHKPGAVGWDGSVTREWWINEISGQDLAFVAFKDERDYLYFMLRWS
jgi:hypothetical protein